MADINRYIKADFHVHTSYSRKVRFSPEEMYISAKNKGMDRIAVTDHNTIRGALQLAEKDPDYIIVGEEITWNARGEIIGLFLKEAVPEGRSARYTLDALHEQGAFIFIPHPFAPFDFYCPPQNILAMSDRIDAIEIVNGRNFQMLNYLAGVFRHFTNIPGICGSDAHTPQNVGRAGLLLPDFTDAESLRNSIRSARPYGRGESVINAMKLLKKIF